MRHSVSALSFVGCFLELMVLAGPSQRQSATPAGRLPFPEGYQDRYQILCRFDKAGKKETVTVYGNDSAASVSSVGELPYPYGSVIVMETSSAVSDSKGKVVLDKTGHYRKDKTLGLHVMGKQRGFGESYRQDRTGEWEYVEYRSDGTYITPPEKSQVCAQCHLKAGRDKDFVYGGRFRSDGRK